MKPRFQAAFATLLVLGSTGLSRAAIYNWNGSTTGGLTGVSNTWDTATANWTGAGSLWPASSTLDDDAIFGGSAGAVTIATGGVTANALSFTSTGYTIGGAALTLDGVTPSLATGSGISATVSSVIAGGAGLTKTGDGTLTLSGANTFTGVTNISAGTLLAGNNAALGSAATAADGTTVSSGAVLDVGSRNLGAEIVTVSGSGIGGNGAIVNSGAEQPQAFRFVTLAGATTFGGPNRWDIRKATTSTFDMGGFDLTKTGGNYLGLVDTTINNPGNVTINQGTLNFTFASTLGLTNANTVTVNNGGILGLYQSNPLHGSNLVLNNGSTFRGENGTLAQNTWAGTVTINGEATFLADGVMTVANTVSGTGNLTKTGASTATIAATTGSIAHTGNLAVNAGTLTVNGSLAHSGNLAVNAGTLTVNGSLAHTGNLAVNAGTVNVNGPSSFAGTTTVTGGTLNLNYATDDNGKLADSQALTLAGGTLALTGGTHGEAVGSTTLKAGTASAVSVISHSGLLALNAITREAGAAVDFNADGIATTDNANANGILGAWATVGGNTWAASDTGLSDGTVVAFNDYVFTGTILNNAALYLSEHVNVDTSASPDAGISALGLVFNSPAANTLTLQGANTLASGGILIGSGVGTNASTITGGSLTGPVGGDLVLNQRNTGAALSIGSTLADNSLTNLVKLGPGTVVLTGPNSYAGTTTISAGSLQIDDAGAIGGTQVTTSGSNSAALLLGNNVVVPATKAITVNGTGANQFFGALSTPLGYTGTSEWQGPVTVGSLTGTRIGTLGGTLRVSGDIGESAAGSQLIVRNNEAAGGTTILSGNNSFTGGLFLTAGNLRMAGANALGAGSFSIGAGGIAHAFSSDGSTPRTITNPTVLSGTGTINLGDATLNGKLTFSNSVDLAATARTVAIASEVEISGSLGGSGSLTKNGAANLILSGNNSHSGATIVSAGRIVVRNPNGLGAVTGNTRINTGGTLELATDTPIAVEPLDMGSGNTGTLVLNRASAGAAVNHVFAATTTLGNSGLNVEAGPNVTSGTPVASFNGILLPAGSAGTLTLNPTSAAIAVTGPVSSTTNFAKTLGLAGTNPNNVISGVVSNGTNTVAVLKSDIGTWVLSGANSYTGATTVSNGTLTLSGNRTVAAGAVNVGDTNAQTGTLRIQGDLPMGTNVLSVGLGSAAGVVGTGIVDHSAGAVTLGNSNQLLIGRTSPGVSGTYNLSGGSLTTFASNTRGVMVGVNDGALGNPINATFNLSGTGVLNNAGALLQVVRGDGASSFQNATYNQTGGTSTNGFLVIGGGVNGAGAANGAFGQNSTATFSVTGGTFSAASFNGLSRANNTSSTITIGGSADVTLPRFPTARGTGSSATLNFDGGTLRPLAADAAYLGGLTNAFIKSGGARFDVASGRDITVSQNLLTDVASTGGGLTKDGAGTLALTGANTYTGNTSVTAGTLSLGNGSANSGLANGADVSVAASALLVLNYSGTDTIDGLTLNGVAKAPGVWGSVASGAPNTDPLLSGSGTLTVTTGPSASPYDSWATGFGLSGLNAGFDVDFDKDGLDNGLEFVLGGDPTLNDVPSKAPVQTLDATDLILTFKRADASIAEVTLSAEWDVDLAGTWTSVAITRTTNGNDTLANGVNVVVTTNGALADDIVVKIPRANAVGNKLFGRIKATKP